MWNKLEITTENNLSASLLPILVHPTFVIFCSFASYLTLSPYSWPFGWSISSVWCPPFGPLDVSLSHFHFVTFATVFFRSCVRFCKFVVWRLLKYRPLHPLAVVSVMLSYGCYFVLWRFRLRCTSKIPSEGSSLQVAKPCLHVVVSLHKANISKSLQPHIFTAS